MVPLCCRCPQNHGSAYDPLECGLSPLHAGSLNATCSQAGSDRAPAARFLLDVEAIPAGSPAAWTGLYAFVGSAVHRWGVILFAPKPVQRQRLFPF
jgi:hypothetical protein